MTSFPSLLSRRTSRRFARLGAVAACCLSLFFGAVASAGQPEQEQTASPIAAIEPFVNADTTAVARLNLQTLDVDKLTATLGDFVATALQNVGYETEAVGRLRPALDETLNAAARDGKAALDAFRAASGLREVYFVVNPFRPEDLRDFGDDFLVDRAGDMNYAANFAFVVPVDALGPTQLELLKKFAKTFADKLDVETGVYQKRWLVFSPNLTAFGRYYKNFQACKVDEFETFFQENADAALAAYHGKIKIRPLLDAATGDETTQFLAIAPRALRVAINLFDASFADLRLTVSPETLVARAEFRFDAVEDAERMSNALYALVDAGLDRFHADAYSFDAPFDSLDAEVVSALNLEPLAREILRAEIRARLPKVDGASLVWELDVPAQADQTLQSSTFFAAAAVLLGLAYGDNF